MCPAQTLTDPSLLRFTHSLELQRVEVLVESRVGAATQFLTAAQQIVSLPEGSRQRRTVLIGEIQYLADSIALLDQEIGEAVAAAGEARHGLMGALEALAVALQIAAEDADPRQRPAFEEQIEELESELEELRDQGDSTDAVDPLSSAAPTLSALTRIVARERARLRTIRRLQDERRLFLGNLRLFDETAMPPSVRGEAGSESEPDVGCGCGIPPPPPTMGSPADLPLEHFSPESNSDRGHGDATAVTVGSLDRLTEQLAASSGFPEAHAGAPDRVGDGSVTREMTLGVTLMTFKGEGNGRMGLRLSGGSSVLFSSIIGGGMQLTVEPWLGGRAVQLGPSSTSAEVAGEVRESLLGAMGGGKVSWQVTAWQKGRFLSDPLPLPAYLEPGRKEGGLASRAAVFLHPQWAVELGGGGNIIRFGPEEWKSLDGQGINAQAALVRNWVSGSARLSAMTSRRGFSLEGDARREDTLMGVGADWSLEGRALVRLTAAVAWNDSRLQAYDYRSERATVVLALPWRGGSILAYGALSHRTYMNPGSEDVRVAPSDQDTGSILVFQLTRPADKTHVVTFRAEWSRTNTGFRNDFYQRLGISAQLGFRGLGGL